MSSLLKQLAGVQKQPDHVADLNFESQDVADMEEIVSSDIGKLMSIATTVDYNLNLVSDNITVADGLTDLVDQTIDTYGERGIDQQGAQLLSISVESFLQARGLNIPPSTLVPSFEDSKNCSDYSTEVLDRKNSVMTKIFSWLYTALKAIADAMKSFWMQMSTSSKGIETYIDKVRALVEQVNDEEPAATSTIRLGGGSLWLADRNDRIAKPDQLLAEAATRYEDFVSEWSEKWRDITSVVFPAKLDSEKLLEDTASKIKTAANKAVGSTKTVISFLPNHELELVLGSGEIPLIDAKIRINPTVAGKNTEAAVLTKKEMLAGLSTATQALDIFKRLDREMNVMVRQTDRIAKLAKDVGIDDKVEIGPAQMRNSVKALGKACSIASWGWTNTAPYYLKTLKASVKYIDASAHRYPKKGD